MLTEVNGYTLLPHNGWSTGAPIKGSRKWQTGIGTGVKGNEQRAALRQYPLYKITCSLTATSLPERARMEARIDQAQRAGIACMPFYGFVMWLAAGAAADSNTLTLSAANIWTWQAGDYVFLYANDTTFDAIEVQGVAGLVLTLAGNLTNSWGAQSNVWPLLFGKFSSDKQGAMSAHLGIWPVTIEQEASARNAQVGVVVAPSGTGIGVDQVGVSNVVD